MTLWSPATDLIMNRKKKKSPARGRENIGTSRPDRPKRLLKNPILPRPGHFAVSLRRSDESATQPFSQPCQWPWSSISTGTGTKWTCIEGNENLVLLCIFPCSTRFRRCGLCQPHRYLNRPDEQPNGAQTLGNNCDKSGCVRTFAAGTNKEEKTIQMRRMNNEKQQTGVTINKEIR